jgi:secondary thiamine-phosphate synthase enzyme
MTITQEQFHCRTKGRCDILNITPQLAEIVARGRLQRGLVNVSGSGSTLGITTLEYEPGCISDFERALEKIAPANLDYAHNARWGDENGYAHLRSALVGTTKSFPIRGGTLELGTWQQIVLCDFDDRPRERTVTVTLIGE